MFKKAFFRPGLALAFLLLFALPVSGAQKDATLQDFDGTWLFDAEKSKAFTKEAANKLDELKGFKFSIDAKARTMRLEWAGFAPKTRKINSAVAEGKTLSCSLEGQSVPILLEKNSDNELLVKDRGEALVFVKIKQ